MKLPDKLETVIDCFSKLQGIGEKTATRHALGLCRWQGGELEKFGHALLELSKLKRCAECGLYCDQDLCSICANTARQSEGTICVVETISDCIAVEHSGQYRGLYHILGGVLNPLMGIGPGELGIHRLTQRVAELGIRDVILAVNPSVEGDATCAYIHSQLGGAQDTIRVERIGLGIPMGGSLEYLDPLTISKAIEYRRSL